MRYFQLPLIVKNINKSFLINLVAFLSTIPYVAPIPINTDIQYPIFIVCLIILLIDILTKRFVLSKLEVYFFFIAFLSFIYVNPFSDFDYRLTKSVGLLFSFFVFYVFRRYWNVMGPKYFIAGIYLNVFVVLLQFIKVDLYSKLISPIVRTLKLDLGASERGLQGLMAEPSFLAGMGAFFLLLSYALYKEQRILKRTFIILVVISIATIVSSNSISAMMFLLPIITLPFLFLRITIINKILLISLFAIIAFTFIFLLADDSSRGLNFLRDIILDPTFIFEEYDLSVITRIIALIGAWESIAQGYIFGHGVGSMQYVSLDLLINSDFAIKYYDQFVLRTTGFISSLSQYIIELGIFFIILIVWLYSHTKFIGYVIYIRIISVFYLLFTFSILFPPFWVLLAITDKSNLEKVLFEPEITAKIAKKISNYKKPSVTKIKLN